MKILIINLHSSRNVGDAALALVSVQLLKANFSEASITLAMNDPTSHSYDETVVGSFLTWFMRQKDEQLVGWHWLAIPWLVIDSLVAVQFWATASSNDHSSSCLFHLAGLY